MIAERIVSTAARNRGMKLSDAQVAEIARFVQHNADGDMDKFTLLLMGEFHALERVSS